MNYFTSTKSNPIATDVIIFIARIFTGFAMLTHGYPKLEKLTSGGEIEFFNFLGLSAETSLFLAVFAEFVCAIFLILGLFTRWATFFLAFTMVIASAVVHGSDHFSEMEKALLYLALFIIFFAFGPGRYSIDGMISRKKERSAW